MEEPVQQQDHIQRISKILSYIIMGLLVILPLGTVIIWLNIDWYVAHFTARYDPETLDVRTRIFGFLFSLLPLSLWMYGLYNLRNLFRNYAAARVFVPKNATFIKRFGWVNIFAGGLTPLFGAVFSVILSMNHDAGKRFISISLGSSEIHIILLGLVFVVIAHVMAAAHRLSEENSQFI